jgi:hypothetical protein
LASRTKKFVKVYKGFFRAQEELKRSQAKLMRLVDDISEDNGPMLDTDVEYLDINTTSYDPPCEIPTNNQANHRRTAAGSHFQRQENDAETGNHLSSSIEEPLLTESNQHRPTTAQQERRRAVVQKVFKQGSLSLKTGDGRDGNATTDHKLSSVVSLNGELK